MPALAQSRSTLPHSFVARSTMAVTCSKFETSAPSTIAVPPALRISSTTASAGESEPPVPSRAPPKSLTTTLAPRLASPRACALPRPLPAPVTMATRPSNLIAIVQFLLLLPSPLVGERGAKRRMRGCLYKRVRGERPLTRLRSAKPPSPTRGEGRIARFDRLLSSDGLPGQARQRRAASTEIGQAEPFRDQRGLVLAFDLHGDVGASLEFVGLAQLGLGQHEAAADALARADRRDEAQLVEAVVHAHRGARDHGHH